MQLTLKRIILHEGATVDRKSYLKSLGSNLMFARRPIRFLAAGAVNTAVGAVLFPVLDTVLTPVGVPYLVTLVLCHFFSVTQSYFLNRIFVFRSNQKFLGPYVLFSAFQWSYLLANLIALPALVAVSGLDRRIVQVGITLAAAICSYLWQTYVVFSKRFSKET